MRSRKSDAMKEEAEIILAQLRAAASRSLERVADTFKRWDADGGGLISRSEFRKAALALFIEGEQRAIDAAFDLLDALLPPLRADSPWRDHVRERPRDYPLGCGRGASLAFEAALKPMLRELLEESSIESARARFEHAGFVTELSPLAFGPTRDGWLGTFESRAEAAGDRSRVRRPLYVGRVRSTLREAIDAEVARTADGARTLGRLLGYPRCCVEAFVVAPDRRASRLWAAAAARKRSPRSDSSRPNTIMALSGTSGRNMSMLKSATSWRFGTGGLLAK
jgi:hypothetical protein